ncbi:uncharacterized protein B0P05DRAFT_538492 [Gilbertella persicaria]|uniref:C2H2-type domain-containing protein n=1 Tax=Rhizopus stolonifer TaxID=4846 RepID=A0A367KKV7_RHIST|nr:uncharacterized protein B0P05DRAFT_538492 [Gilbertella persicaria]KAI8081889.1 hypothetical protein B0P05DRAFT_538492 [Gilbertella persicaria]RCI02799.1 hypothetical protein CU098_007857 [Rhizopus stolonifer]
MADDGEWHTVTSTKATTLTPPPPPSQPSKNNNRRKSKPKIHVHKKEKKPIPPRPKTVTNPFHSGEDDDSEEEEQDDGQVDPIDLPVPPYHTSIVVSCPLPCESPAPFLDTTSLVQHLRTKHKLVFKNLHHMYMALDTYLLRWANEFGQKPMDEFAYLDQEVYVIDPEKCSLDKEIREDMQRAKLNEVLKTQQNERETESKLPRKCLFCKIICENRAVLFKHMFAEHNFNIGLPDNLVNVNEFLDTLEAKLSNLQCLYCEKTFTSPAVLRKHMRKKKHFKIASKNRQYDRFYVINYLEPGKNWESFENETYESDDEKKDESWADWEEDVQESTMCLFDTQVLASPKEALEHMSAVHGFDLTSIRKSKGLDFYQTIVLINYIRHQSSLGHCFSCGSKGFDSENDLTEHVDKEGCIAKFVPMDAPFWKDPRYLIPTYENDPLLTGFEQDNEEDEDDALSDDEANKKYLHQVMEESLILSDNQILK